MVVLLPNRREDTRQVLTGQPSLTGEGREGTLYDLTLVQNFSVELLYNNQICCRAIHQSNRYNLKWEGRKMSICFKCGNIPQLCTSWSKSCNDLTLFKVSEFFLPQSYKQNDWQVFDMTTRFWWLDLCRWIEHFWVLTLWSEKRNYLIQYY